MTDRHAYLITCHNNIPILKRLLMLLDDPRNDIYIHVDKKTQGFPFVDCAAVVKQAVLTYIDRQSVAGGGASMVWVEMALLKAATQKEHVCYHLISGVDMPLKTQDEIHKFFREHQGKEFMSFDHHAIQTGNHIDRVRYYHVFWDKIGRNRVRPLRAAERILLLAQRALKVDRTRHAPMTFYKGANWFSITHDLAVYLLSRAGDIKQYFRMSFCGDELFLQTIAMDSTFKDCIVDDDLREIDWKRGNPYTYTAEDFEMLTASDKLFARKFDSAKDMQIVEDLFRHIAARQGGSAAGQNPFERG